MPASDNVYEYIVFRGSDVKDLRIEKEPEKPTQQPQVPDDPAILGVSLFFLPPYVIDGCNQALHVYHVGHVCALRDEVFRMIITNCTTESANPCGNFRCLPSDIHNFHSMPLNERISPEL